jgi:DNA polymerase-3 subunit beta
MEIKILKEDFLKALNVAQGVVEKKNVMPILSNILLEAEGAMLKLSVTDLEVAVNVLVPAQIKAAGKITLSAKSLFDIVRESPGDHVELKLTDNNFIQISSKQSQYRLLSLPANEFPKLPKVEGEFSPVETESFLSMLDKVTFAMSTDETRYHLNGVLIDKLSNSEIALVATDGHRLAYSQKNIALPFMKQKKIILPRKGVAEMRKMAAGQKVLKMSIGERHVFVQNEMQTLFVRLIDGEFPDYSRVIPEGNPLAIPLPRQELAGALKRVSLLSSDRSHGVNLYFCNNSLTVSASNPEIGEAKEEIVINYKGDLLNIGFNAKYFIDVLSVITDENVIVEFKDALSPSLVKAPSDAGFKSVIMPMRM